MENGLQNSTYLSSKRNIVLDPLVDFKSMFISDLFEKQSEVYGKSKQAFYRLICRMHDDGLINKVDGLDNNRKIVYLSKDASKIVGVDHIQYADRDTLRHDALVASVILDLEKKLNCRNVEIPSNNSDGFGLVPDAWCSLDLKGRETRVAIEIELTRKARQRQINKMNSYLDLNNDALALYIFDKRGVYNSYKENLKFTLEDQGISETSCNIILCYSPFLLSATHDLLDSEIFITGRNSKLGEVLNV